jgi:hypothetical protein
MFNLLCVDMSLLKALQLKKFDDMDDDAHEDIDEGQRPFLDQTKSAVFEPRPAAAAVEGDEPVHVADITEGDDSKKKKKKKKKSKKADAGDDTGDATKSGDTELEPVHVSGTESGKRKKSSGSKIVSRAVAAANKARASSSAKETPSPVLVARSEDSMDIEGDSPVRPLKRKRQEKGTSDDVPLQVSKVLKLSQVGNS